MANITVTGSTFNDNASVVQNLYEASESIDYSQIEKELQAIKDKLEKGSQEYQVVEVLEQNSKAHSWEAICATIKAFAFQFSSAALANLAGSYLSQRLGL